MLEQELRSLYNEKLEEQLKAERAQQKLKNAEIEMLRKKLEGLENKGGCIIL